MDTLVTTISFGGIALLLIFTQACSAPAEAEDVATAEQEAVGDFLPGLVTSSPDLLDEAGEAFRAVEAITDGVGPIFNERACGACHTEGAVGGAGVQLERRFGTFTAGGIFDPLDELGGTLRQLFSVGNFNNPNLPAASRGRCQPGNPTLCCVPVEREPAQATVRNVGRLTTALFGLGLVDSIPDAFFDGLAAAQPAAIRGVVNRVPTFLPNPGDPSQTLLGARVGRFGWKAAVPTLMQFSADAYNNEMAITTQSCFRGTTVNTFALENIPNALAGTGIDGCDDLAPRQPSETNPGGLTAAQWAQVDDPVGSCAGGRTEIQDDVFLFTVFMTALAPAPRDFSDATAVSRGDPLFTSAGCSGCHVRTTFRTPANPAPVDIGNGEEFVRVPANFAFNPFSDFLKHDMGALGDRIGEAPPDDPAQGLGDTVAQTRQMRTAPLWGSRFRNRFLHDGRCSDIACAIRAHDGQGVAARNAFNALSGTNQHYLVQFVRSL
ncbi:MAG TPA: di-heme oxidoredictase family protein [Polyangiaceae bacterium]